jgi:putative phosphoesterase
VHGNVDSEDLRERLPEARVVAADGAKIAMVHDAGPATGRLQRLRARFPDADAVVFGHSHIPLHEERDGFQIFNPGSPTDRRRQPHHTMGQAEIADGEVRFKLIALD